MPTYQYACKNADCANEFELVQSFSDAAVTECPSCGGPVRKVFGAVGVVFKGSGFYRTDSRASATKSEPKAASSGDKKPEPAAKPAEKKPAATGSGSAGKAAATA